MARPGYVLDPRYLEHIAGYQHVESPARLESIQAMLQETGLEKRLIQVMPRPASEAELTLVHTPQHVETIAQTAGREFTSLDPDTLASAASYEVARLAAGGCLALVEAALEGAVAGGFAFVRPPGHHATPRRAMGFCLFNNIAVAAAHAVLNRKLSRVLIVDWDLHHGNGTQEVFYQKGEVLFFSTHQYPYYPGTGSLKECGAGPGEGFTVNVPIAGGFGDADYVAVFQRVLEPIADEFRPELVLVSAGFDAYEADPLGAMKLTPEGFAALARIVLSVARRHAQGRCVFVLEGGYHLKGLALGAHHVLHELLDDPPPGVTELLASSPSERCERLTSEVIKVQRRWWPVLG
jgi:acetoin utilization deacetylase AcuC-like enzyme